MNFSAPVAHSVGYMYWSGQNYLTVNKSSHCIERKFFGIHLSETLRIGYILFHRDKKKLSEGRFCTEICLWIFLLICNRLRTQP